jgi:hypothetical protein
MCRCSPPLPPLPRLLPTTGNELHGGRVPPQHERIRNICLFGKFVEQQPHEHGHLPAAQARHHRLHPLLRLLLRTGPSPLSTALPLLIPPPPAHPPQYLPLLFKHFNEEGIPSETFLLDWYLTVFSKVPLLSLPLVSSQSQKALPLEVAARMWDCYLLAGEVFILRGALGLLRLFAARLATLSMEKILPFLAHVPEEALNVDDLMDNIQQATSPVPSLLLLISCPPPLCS